jgi:hypothetical protein
MEYYAGENHLCATSHWQTVLHKTVHLADLLIPVQSVSITTKVRTLFMARCTVLCNTVCQWLVAHKWFSPA